MNGIRIFCEDERNSMNRDEIIREYLFLKERFLELLATDAEKERLIKNLSERLNQESAKKFGRSTETSSSLSEIAPERGPDASARKALAEPDTDAPPQK